MQAVKLQSNSDIRSLDEELNEDLKLKTEPLEREAGQIKKRLEEIDDEIGRYVKAFGQGKFSIERLESEIARKIQSNARCSDNWMTSNAR